MDAWHTAVQFLLIDDRAQVLADAHPLTEDGQCGRCTPPGCTAAALAAGEQGRGWNYVNLFYRNQGKEASGYADDEFLTAIAKAAGVKDLDKWNEDRNSAKVKNEVRKTDEEAKRLGFTGTPSFAVKGPNTNGLELLGNLSSAGEIEAAIDAAS